LTRPGLKRFRRLLNEYDAVAVGEVGDEERSLQTMADYTSGPDMLQMCYSFELLGPAFSPEHIRNTVDGFNTVATQGWPCWAFSNHDVERHVSRWSGTNDSQEAAKFCIALLASLRGSLCLYQGEELGLTEAVLTFEELQDPYGIRFWPDFKGRDGCRTPYPWDRKEPNAGFTGGKPWLPVSEEHLAHSYVQEAHEAGSVLGHYRTILKARNASEILLRGDIKFLESTKDTLVFERSNDSGRILCVFNFGSKPVDSFTRGVSVKNGKLELDPLGFALLAI
jgi:alpha-glucosidase